LFLNEGALIRGIDQLSAMQVINKIKSEDGKGFPLNRLRWIDRADNGS